MVPGWPPHHITTVDKTPKPCKAQDEILCRVRPSAEPRPATLKTAAGIMSLCESQDYTGCAEPPRHRRALARDGRSSALGLHHPCCVAAATTASAAAAAAAAAQRTWRGRQRRAAAQLSRGFVERVAGAQRVDYVARLHVARRSVPGRHRVAQRGAQRPEAIRVGPRLLRRIEPPRGRRARACAQTRARARRRDVIGTHQRAGHHAHQRLLDTVCRIGGGVEPRVHR